MNLPIRMKKIKLLLAIAFLFITTSIVALQKDYFSPQEKRTSTTYHCKFTSIQMNGKTKEFPKKTYPAILSENPNGTFNLDMELPKMGKMPGKLSIHANGIKTDTKGNITQTIPNSLYMKILFTHKYDAHFKGEVIGNLIKLSIKTVKASYMGINIHAVFSFEGTNK